MDRQKPHRPKNLLAPMIVTVGLAAMIADTAVPRDSTWNPVLDAVVAAVAVALAAEFLIRFWTASSVWHSARHSRWQARVHYLTTLHGMIDAAGAVALPLGYLLVSDPRDAQLFTIVWVLKYLLHSTGLMLLMRVAFRARTALFSVMTLFFVVFVGAATMAYVFERNAQPDVFGSVPLAMWWAIVTLTTTGYGDMVPTTIWGRLLGGWVMVGGIAVFALWAGIIANAFTEELRRRNFLRTWDLVAHVPLFQDLGAAAIADIVKLLHPRDVAEGTVLFRKGQVGDTMYFIVTGEVSVDLRPAPKRLGAGEFVGEMALLFGAPRSATVVATRPSLLLVLDIANFRELAGQRPELITTIEAEAHRRRASDLAATA
jgi:voltage-gated potassium channel